MSGINLNINDYTIKDLESLFKLPVTYTGADVELKEYELKTQLFDNPAIDKRYKTEFVLNFPKYNSKLFDKLKKIGSKALNIGYSDTLSFLGEITSANGIDTTQELVDEINKQIKKYKIFFEVSKI